VQHWVTDLSLSWSVAEIIEIAGREIDVETAPHRSPGRRRWPLNRAIDKRTFAMTNRRKMVCGRFKPLMVGS
jgi:hypothetical protein